MFPFIMATFYLARLLITLFPKRFIQTEANLSNNANLIGYCRVERVKNPQRCANSQPIGQRKAFTDCSKGRSDAAVSKSARKLMLCRSRSASGSIPACKHLMEHLVFFRVDLGSDLLLSQFLF